MSALFPRGLLGLVFAAAAVGCATGPKPAPAAVPLSSAVNATEVAAEDSARLRLSADQVFLPGELIDKEIAPRYPQQLLALRLPEQVVCVRFVVGTDGVVSEVAPVFGLPGCPAGEAQMHPEFLAATVEAVSRWEFFSFQVCTLAKAQRGPRKCGGSTGTVQPIAVTLTYQFAFAWAEGRGTVRQGESGPVR